MCRVGSDADGPGREHWAAMLANPRKPIEHWHQLVEVRTRIGTLVNSSVIEEAWFDNIYLLLGKSVCRKIIHYFSLVVC